MVGFMDAHMSEHVQCTKKHQGSRTLGPILSSEVVGITSSLLILVFFAE